MSQIPILLLYYTKRMLKFRYFYQQIKQIEQIIRCKLSKNLLNPLNLLTKNGKFSVRLVYKAEKQ